MDPAKLSYSLGMPHSGEEVSLVGAPEGAHVRLRFRNDELPYAFVRTAAGIRKFVIGRHPSAGHLNNFLLGYEVAANVRVRRPRQSAIRNPQS
jgi:hypothetical protein